MRSSFAAPSAAPLLALLLFLCALLYAGHDVYAGGGENAAVERTPRRGSFLPLLLRRGGSSHAAALQPATDRAAYCASSAGVDAAAQALTAWSRHARHPQIRYYSRTLTMGTLASVHDCTTDMAGDTRLSDLAIVVMGSAALRERLVAFRAGWGARAASAGARLFYVSDVVDAELATIALPGAGEPSYTGAQNRSLKGLLHAVHEAPGARWYWMIDDDTYFNAGEVLAAVRYVQWRLPLIIGHVFRGMLRFRNVAGTWPSGGAGMLLSHATAHAISGALFTAECPWLGLNDQVIGHCAYALGIPMIHHHGWQPEMEGRILTDLTMLGSISEMGSYASLHMLHEMYAITRLQDELAQFKFAPLNDSLSFQLDRG